MISPVVEHGFSGQAVEQAAGLDGLSAVRSPCDGQVCARVANGAIQQVLRLVTQRLDKYQKPNVQGGLLRPDSNLASDQGFRSRGVAPCGDLTSHTVHAEIDAQCRKH